MLTKKGIVQINAIFEFSQSFRTDILIICRESVQKQIFDMQKNKLQRRVRTSRAKNQYLFLNGSRILLIDRIRESDRGMKTQMVLLDENCNITETELYNLIYPMCMYPIANDRIIKLSTKADTPDYQKCAKCLCRACFLAYENGGAEGCDDCKKCVRQGQTSIDNCTEYYSYSENIYKR